MPPSPVRVGLLGCGVVGAGLLRLLRQREAAIERALGTPLRVTRLAVTRPGKPRDVDLSGIEVGTDAVAIAGAEDVDLVVELMGGVDAALPAVTQALTRGVPVVTANKLLLSIHGERLAQLAASTGAALRYEASVAGAIPVLQSLEHGLRTERFNLLVAILNGTTNFILSTMEREGRDFAEALAAARSLGFAEADPTLDLSGADTAQKLTILVRSAFRIAVPHDSIPTEGIVGMELEDLRQADRFGYVVKLLGIALRTPDGIDIRVHPAFIPKRYLLASVRDEFNAVYLRGEATGSMLFYGKGAGSLPTAQAVLGDAIAAARELLSRDGPLRGGRVRPQAPVHEERLPLDEVRLKYYIRLLVEDQPGVLARIAERLGSARVSVAQMFQAPEVRGEASITMLTHEASDKDVRDAVAKIAALPSVRKTPRAVRIFDI